MADRWRLRLLPVWELTGPDRVVLVGGNAQRLLACLALRGACDRAYLAGLLWPECTDQHALGNLRATVSRLRRRELAGVLENVNGSLGLRPEVTVDVRELLAIATGALNGSVPTSSWSAVRMLTAGDLLTGWYDEWVLTERQRLRQLRLHALEALSAHLVAVGNEPAAVEAGLEAVAIDPLRESAHRAVIRAHLAEGNLVEARRQLEQLRSLLQAELGVEPSVLATNLFR